MKIAKAPSFKIESRSIGEAYAPLVIAEIGINHEGSVEKAKRMIDDAKSAGCEVVKFQCHVIEDEMIQNNVVPGNAKESIWDIMSRAALSEADEIKLKAYTEYKGMIYLSTPFSRAAADRLQRLGVSAFKIGSGECNNYPLIAHIAKMKKPVILSTGMNSLDSIDKAVKILRQQKIPYALMHCTSVYPTPYSLVRLGALAELGKHFPDAVLGLSDHSLSNYPCLGAVSLGARVLERHFTSDKSWSGPDIPISMDPKELKELVAGSRAIFESLGGKKGVLSEESPTIKFAYASVVTIRPIKKGEKFSKDNIWVKRPGTGEILAVDFESLLGKTASRDINPNEQLKWSYVEEKGSIPYRNAG